MIRLYDRHKYIFDDSLLFVNKKRYSRLVTSKRKYLF